MSLMCRFRPDQSTLTGKLRPLKDVAEELSGEWQRVFAVYQFVKEDNEHEWKVRPHFSGKIKYLLSGSSHAVFEVNVAALSEGELLWDLWKAWMSLLEEGALLPRIGVDGVPVETPTFVIRVAHPLTPDELSEGMTAIDETESKNESLKWLEDQAKKGRFRESLPHFTPLYFAQSVEGALPVMLMETLVDLWDWYGDDGKWENPNPTAVSVLEGCCRFADNVCDTSGTAGMAYEMYMEDTKATNLMFRLFDSDRTDIVFADLESCVPMSAVATRENNFGQTYTGRNQGTYCDPYIYDEPAILRFVASKFTDVTMPWERQDPIGQWVFKMCRQPENTAKAVATYENLCVVGNSLLTIAIGAIARVFDKDTCDAVDRKIQSERVKTPQKLDPTNYYYSLTTRQEELKYYTPLRFRFSVTLQELKEQLEEYSEGLLLDTNEKALRVDIVEWMAWKSTSGNLIFPNLNKLVTAAINDSVHAKQLFKKECDSDPGYKTRLRMELLNFVEKYQTQWASVVHEPDSDMPRVRYRANRFRAEGMDAVRHNMVLCVKAFEMHLDMLPHPLKSPKVTQMQRLSCKKIQELSTILGQFVETMKALRFQVSERTKTPVDGFKTKWDEVDASTFAQFAGGWRY